MLKLWGRTNSINVMKALWCLDELGLEYEQVDAGMQYGVVNEASYRALNPNGRVPTLDDDGFTLWESNVIVRYLCARYGAGTLCPDNLQDRARAEQWMDWQQTTPHEDITFVFWGTVRGKKENQDPKLLSSAAQRLGQHWSVVEAALEGRQFLVGNELTMADIPLGAAAWRWYNLATDRPTLPNVEAWYGRLQERAAYRKHVMLPLT